jgi:hypothetical protein
MKVSDFTLAAREGPQVNKENELATLGGRVLNSARGGPT